MNIQIGKNQYLLTQTRIDGDYSNIEQIGEYFLYLGEKCNFYGYQSKVFVIGYAIDVETPYAPMEDMCEQLIVRIEKGIYGPNATRTWNGRYIILAYINNILFAWHDCCGLKQIFYANFNNRLILSSQARYIAQLAKYEKNEEATIYLHQAHHKDNEYCWPVDRTNYKEVRRLLPNHLINLTNYSVLRTDFSFEKYSAEKGAQIICNSLIGASKDRKLAVTVTAGWDSRIVLSGCKNIKNMSAVTLKYDWMQDNNDDIKTAIELCKLIEVKHEIIECQLPESAFWAKYLKHSDGGHEYWAQMAEAVQRRNYNECFWVKGSCNEILRNSFGFLYSWQIDSSVLCALYKLPKVPFVTDAIDEWLKGAKPYCKSNKIGVLDLFYWEHRMGSWLAECVNEFDYVGETFTPFNSRKYIEVLYLANRRTRIPPNYKLFKLIIEHNNDLLLKVPLNKERYKGIKATLSVIIKNHSPIIYKKILENK